MPYTLMIVDREESNDPSLTRLKKPGAILAIHLNEEKARWEALEISWDAAWLLVPDQVDKAMAAWRLHHPTEPRPPVMPVPDRFRDHKPGGVIWSA